MDELKKLFSRVKADKRVALIVVAGVLGIIFLTLSELMPDKTENSKSEAADAGTQTVSEYEKNLEERLSSLISEIDGAGKTSVMLTLDCGDENIYASRDKLSETSSEKEYVLIENDGNQTGLLLKVTQPEVRGVAVVCEGADSSEVRQEITGLITAVLGVSTNRVNIAKMKITNGG